jgi:hypothetical protein
VYARSRQKRETRRPLDFFPKNFSGKCHQVIPPRPEPRFKHPRGDLNPPRLTICARLHGRRASHREARTGGRGAMEQAEARENAERLTRQLEAHQRREAEYERRVEASIASYRRRFGVEAR